MTKNLISLIITVKNEAGNIRDLLMAVKNQTHQPAEIIITDGGSTDDTVAIMTKFAQQHPQWPLKIIAPTQKNQPPTSLNISQGRNLAVCQAKYPLLAITDAGCLPEPSWLDELIKTYQQTKAPVIAGFYRGLARTSFEQAVVPYVLVMPDQLQTDHFLPASRSMLMEKKVWQQLGGWREDLPVSEDYAFAKLLQQKKIPIAVAAQAIVGWRPRSNVADFWKMIYQFAKSDWQAGLIRGRNLLVWGRYLLAGTIIGWLSWQQNLILASLFIVVSLVLYSGWAIKKNWRYVPQGRFWLPILQLAADSAIMAGSGQAIIQKKLKWIFFSLLLSFNRIKF